MYQITYQFSLDIAEIELKKLCDSLQMPYPYLQHYLKTELTITYKTIPTKEQTDEIIQEYIKALQGTTIGQHYIVDVHYQNIKEIIQIPDNPSEKENIS